MKARRNLKDWIRLAVQVIAVVVLVVSLSLIAVREYQYYKADQDYKDIRSEVPTLSIAAVFDSPTGMAVVSPTISAPFETLKATDVLLTSDGILPEYVTLYKLNPQMAGWIRFPGWTTKPVDYPIMYSGDNSYYLYRDFNQHSSYSGSLFMDGANDPRTLDRNIVVYGHAMKDKSMFGHLDGYPSTPSYYESNRIIYVDLLWTRLEYEVFSTYYIQASGEYRQTHFSSDKEFGDYVAMLKARSVFDFGVDVGPTDDILTLSTCQPSVDGLRAVIHARLVRQIVYDRSDISSAQISGTPTGATSAVVPSYMPKNQPSPTPRPSNG